jgi:transposase-like protein
MKQRMTKRKSGGQQVYSDSFKILVSREDLTGKFSYSQLAEKYNLPGEATPRYFMKWYQQWESNLDLEVPQVVDSEDPGIKNEQELRDELFEANLKITALEILIKKAEELHGAGLVKKSGAKSSKK